MSNPIDLIYAKGVKQELIDVRSELKSTYELIVQLSGKKIDFFGGKSPTTPAGLQKVISDYDALGKKSDAITTKIINNKEKERLAEIKLQKDRENAFDKYEKILQKEENAYNRIGAEIARLTPIYNNLAAKQAQGQKLTNAEINELNKLMGTLKTYQGQLQTIDAAIGKHQRNVGNYASANRNLTASIGQISRELPNFGQSFQVGVLSLTNNIGAIIDSIDQVKKQNRELAAEGKKTSSALSQVLQATLNWQTALFIGIGIFSAYSKEIGAWASEIWNATDALTANEEAQKKVSDAQERFNGTTSKSIQNAIKEQDETQRLRRVIQDETKDRDERLNAADRFIKKFPGFLSEFTKEQVLIYESGKATQQYKDAIDALSSAQTKRADAAVKANEAEKTLADALDIATEIRLRQQLNDEFNKTGVNIDKLKKKIEDRADKLNDNEDFVAKYGKAELDAFGRFSQIGINRLEVIYKQLRAQAEIERKAVNDAYVATSKLDYQREKAERERKANREDIDPLVVPKSADEVFTNSLDQLKKYRSEMEELQLAFTDNIEVYKQYQQVIDNITESINGLTIGYTFLREGSKKDLKEIEDNWKAQEKYAEQFAQRIKKASGEMKSYLESFSADLFDGAGFSELFDVLSGKVQGFGKSFQSEFSMIEQQYKSGAITAEQYTERIKQLNQDQINSYATTAVALAEITQEVNNFAQQITKQRFDAERAQLEEQYTLASALAEGNAEQQKKIDEQAERRRKDINKRQNEAEKKQAKFNVIVDTAQAVISELARGGYIAAAFAAALGAAQLAVINAAEVPAYATGTDYAKEGLAWTQEKGREIITDRSGKIKSMGSGKGAVLTPLKAGDKVKTASETTRILREAALNNMLSEIGGINLVGSNISNISSNDNSDVVEEIRSLSTTIKNAPRYTQVRDKAGEALYEQKQGVKKRLANAHLNMKSN